MTILFKPDPVVGGAENWRAQLAKRLPNVPFRVWPDVGDPADIQFFLGFKAATGDFAGMINLKAVLATGAGVDGIFLAEDVPDVPIARIIDPWMTEQMAQWAVYAVLHFCRRFGDYHGLQASGDWQELEPWRAAPAHIGLLGCGEIGLEVAERLDSLGFKAAGWTRRARDLGAVENFHGADGLKPFLARSNFLICLLPLTSDTEGMVDAEMLAALPEDAYFINMARGRVAKTDDLTAALQSGRLKGAFLDVTEPEPLPSDHPLWRMPNVRITPHNSGNTNADTAADQVAENIRRALNGEPLLNVVERSRGY